jgi:hypothetical protein
MRYMPIARVSPSASSFGKNRFAGKSTWCPTPINRPGKQKRTKSGNPSTSHMRLRSRSYSAMLLASAGVAREMSLCRRPRRRRERPRSRASARAANRWLADDQPAARLVSCSHALTLPLTVTEVWRSASVVPWLDTLIVRSPSTIADRALDNAGRAIIHRKLHDELKFCGNRRCRSSGRIRRRS